MKPWTNHLFETQCANCGQPGYHRDAWHWGVVFVCAEGCDPEEVAAYQKRKFQSQNKKSKDVFSEGEGKCD